MRAWTLLNKQFGEWGLAKTCIPEKTEVWLPDGLEYSPIIFFTKEGIEKVWGDVARRKKGIYTLYCINFKKEELK